MIEPNNELSRKAYHEAGRALALYLLCFNLAKGYDTQPPTENPPTLLRFCRGFEGLSVTENRTNWRDVAEAWRATHLILLGGCAAERIKWKIVETPSLSDSEFEKAYYATQWFWVDLDRNPSGEQVLRETIAGLNLATRQLESQWKAVDGLVKTLLEKSQLSAEETFRIISENIDFEKLEFERKTPPPQSQGMSTNLTRMQVTSKSRVKVSYEIIGERDLKSQSFSQCCDGNGDSFPFKCSVCGHIMVFCYECDTLYPDLENTATMQLHIGRHFRCPQCNYEFDDDFMTNPIFYVTPKDWKQAGYESLLTEEARKKLLRR